MNHYRQSIALFGIALPVLVLALLLGLGFMAKNSMTTTFAKKQALFKAFQASRAQTLQIEDSVTRQKDHLSRWNTLLAEDALSALNSNLRVIAEGLPAKEFQKGGFERSAATGPLGSASAQKSSEIRISFRGTFRTMQRAFLELESRLPQLQLQELRITPNQNQQNPSPLLNFQVTYLAWEN